jgi:hypothetical protein
LDNYPISIRKQLSALTKRVYFLWLTQIWNQRMYIQ